MRIATLDTTLRYIRDPRIAAALDDLGIDYLETGDGPVVPLRHARLIATVTASAWLAHARTINAAAPGERIRHLKDQGREVLFYAEHFFDGFLSDARFALGVLESARRAGADILCLCDTAGGSLPQQVSEICLEVRKRFDGILAIHAYNDAGLAVANTLAAVEQGFTLVAGSLNGCGERSGDACLASVIADLELKLGHTTIGADNLRRLTEIARLVAECAGLPITGREPYTGARAFEWSGADWLHASPEAVGNLPITRPDVSDAAALLRRFAGYHALEQPDDEICRHLADRLKELEGCDLDSAEGTLEVLVRETLGQSLLEPMLVEVTARRGAQGEMRTHAAVTIRLGEAIRSASASGEGPLHALDLCLRQCLATLCPAVAQLQLLDYHVRVLDPGKGTAARVRVRIEWSEGGRRWATLAVSENIIDASWRALLDAMRLVLLHSFRITSHDEYLWGV